MEEAVKLKDHSQAVLEAVKEKKKGNRFILGIDGLSRSGKTTLTKSLCESLKEQDIPHIVFHIDDHIVEKKRRYDTGRDEWFEYYFLQWDLQDIREHFFENLLLGKTFSLNYYDSSADSHTLKTIQLPEECFIIVEGVFLQRQEWRDYFDYVVFLDCPKNRRFQRERKETQEQLKKFQNRYWKAEDFYMKAVSPRQKCDMVLRV
ncbi:kinase [Bacillus sp. SG-1]|uniref:kinase n=1 Tax=Bacillus sp. SG-1 TaxID=161544 RepID=UPI0001543F61|nr:uridine kinase [Bacillus sp. SG-1]